MEKNVDQMLQQGVGAHNAGNLQEAERLYLAILETQPKHPDASHNLGLIAASENQSDASLSLFKTALEANPTIEQFWLSYIEALITQGQFEDAKKALNEGKRNSVTQEKFKALTLRLASVKAGNIATQVPSKVELQKIIEHFQTGSYKDAEELASSMTQQFPSHPFSWKILGGIYNALGRMNDALAAGEKSVELDPDDNQAHNSLGVILENLGRFEEAEASYRKAVSLKPDDCGAHYNLGNTLRKLIKLEAAAGAYRQAIAVKPDFAEGYSNLGITLQELGRLEEAEVSLRQALAIRPDFTVGHYNLGNALKELGRLEEAEGSYRKSLAINPDYAEAHNNLGNMLKEQGKLEGAEASYGQAIALEPNYAEAHNNLGATLQELGRLEEAEASYMLAISTHPKSLQSNLPIWLYEYSRCITYLYNADDGTPKLEKLWADNLNEIDLRVRLPLAINNFLTGDLVSSRKLVSSYFAGLSETQKLELKKDGNYWGLLDFILDWDGERFEYGKSKSQPKTLYVIGDSHILSSHGIKITKPSGEFLCKSEWVWGCKQWHLGQSKSNKFKYKFEKIICSLPPESEVLLCIGQIDCFMDEGILLHCKKNPKKKMSLVISETVNNYLSYISQATAPHDHKITIQGIPCPNVGSTKILQPDTVKLVELVAEFDRELKNISISLGFGFLDLHQLTDNGEGFSNELWHVDAHHITPTGIQEAWQRNCRLKL